MTRQKQKWTRDSDMRQRNWEKKTKKLTETKTQKNWMRQRDRITDWETKRQKNWLRDKVIEELTEKQTDKLTEKQTEKLTEKQRQKNWLRDKKQRNWLRDIRNNWVISWKIIIVKTSGRLKKHDQKNFFFCCSIMYGMFTLFTDIFKFTSTSLLDNGRGVSEPTFRCR